MTIWLTGQIGMPIFKKHKVDFGIKEHGMARWCEKLG